MINQNNKSLSDSWLWLGLIVGAVGFLLTLLWDGLSDNYKSSNSDQVVAVVNNVDIDRANYVSQVAALAEDKRNPLTNQDTDYVLQRIIEEELLVQRGIEVRLTQSDRKTRASIVDSMINMITSDANSYQPTENELEDFYNKRLDYFKSTARMRVVRLNINTSNAMQKAREIQSALQQGQGITSLITAGVIRDRYLPNTLLPAQKLREYIGPTQTKSMMSVPVGHSKVIDRGEYGASLFYLQERENVKARPFLDVRELVEGEFTRHKGDKALRDYLNWLKKRADIKVVSKLSVSNP